MTADPTEPDGAGVPGVPDRPPAPAGPPEIRAAVPADAPGILALIRELAAYEREPDAVMASVADLAGALGGDHPVASALVAQSADGAIVGLALWFRTFSTWTGQPGMWLEDLYVSPAHRREGTGRRLFQHLAALCVAAGWPRLEWTVLDWNSPAQAFYASLGAVAMSDWTTNRVTGQALARLAAPAP